MVLIGIVVLAVEAAMDRVVAGASLKPVFVALCTDPADKDVIAGAAIEGVESGAAVERVGAAVPDSKS